MLVTECTFCQVGANSALFGKSHVLHSTHVISAEEGGVLLAWLA